MNSEPRTMPRYSEHPLIALDAHDFQEKLQLRGWSEKKAVRFAKAWAKRRQKRLQR